MYTYFGDYNRDDEVNFDFTTVSPSQNLTSLVGGVVAVFKDDSLVPITFGVTLTIDSGGVGDHHIRIDTSADSAYSPGSDFTVKITSGTVSGIDVTGSVVGTFSIENRSNTDPSPTISGITAYQSVDSVDQYARTKLYTTDWDNSTFERKTKIIFEATRLIDALAYIGYKADSDQEHEFPRGTDTEVPQDILKAHAELSIELASTDGHSTVNAGIRSERFAAVSVTYDTNSTSQSQRAGIISEMAWNYLYPYLVPFGSVKLHRVS